MTNFSRHNRERAFTILDLLMLVIIITFLLLFYLSHTDRGVRERAFRIQCINNLKQTGMALDTWASDHNEKFPMEISQTNGGTMEFASGANEWRHFQIMSNELVNPMVLRCPADKLRRWTTNLATLNNSNISFFINLDYSRPNPHALWSGDRNLTNGLPLHNGVMELSTNPPASWTAEMHKRAGNLLMFDGSVQRVDEAGLRQTVANSGTFTNRLQMPVLNP